MYSFKCMHLDADALWAALNVIQNRNYQRWNGSIEFTSYYRSELLICRLYFHLVVLHYFHLISLAWFDCHFVKRMDCVWARLLFHLSLISWKVLTSIWQTLIRQQLKMNFATTLFLSLSLSHTQYTLKSLRSQIRIGKKFISAEANFRSEILMSYGQTVIALCFFLLLSITIMDHWRPCKSKAAEKKIPKQIKRLPKFFI